MCPLYGLGENFGKYCAYVMQDDILFMTFTPREAFRFAAKLKLKCHTYLLLFRPLLAYAQKKLNSNESRSINSLY